MTTTMQAKASKITRFEIIDWREGGKGRQGNVTRNAKEQNAEILGIELPEGTKNQRKLLRNAVDPKLGLHILNAAMKQEVQETLL